MAAVLAVVLVIAVTCFAAEFVRASCKRQLLTPIRIESRPGDGVGAERSA